MRNGQNKRMRGRNNNNHVHNSSNNHGQHRKSHNPMARVYESNGPEVKIRGNPAHIAEKYMQLARDAQTSGDPISAENYFQHAEHYFRLIATAQEQFRQNNPHLPRQETEITGARDEGYGEGGDDDDDTQPSSSSPAPARSRRPTGRANSPTCRATPSRSRTANSRSRSPVPAVKPVPVESSGDIERLPSFITGGQGSAQPALQGNGQNGHDAQGERFPLHRRRRRHRGPRNEAAPGGESRGSDQPPREE